MTGNTRNARVVHPFPARMAPEIALEECALLKPRAVVVDPMAGSGTALHAAVENGHSAIGFDLDPLAVLITKVRTCRIDMTAFQSALREVSNEANTLLERREIPFLAHIDRDQETRSFLDFWFAPSQQRELRILSAAIARIKDHNVRDALYVAMSRLIITKEKGASLARDVSHSRPHKVQDSNDFQVIEKFRSSGKRLGAVLSSELGPGSASISLGDARDTKLAASSADVVITSPPYLNAIDYLRGHKLALVWMGMTIREIRDIRSVAVGSERGLLVEDSGLLKDMRAATGGYSTLSPRYQKVVDRYLIDLLALYTEQARIIRHKGSATTVIGNCAVRGSFLRNDLAAIIAAEANGLTLSRHYERELPPNRRYLPPPTAGSAGQLNQRMRTESVIRFHMN